MTARFAAFGAVALLTAMAASSAVSPSRLNALRSQATPGAAHLYAIGTRSAEQRGSPTAAKMDAVLADLSRHAARAREGRVLADLHALSPAARFSRDAATGAPLVLVDAVTRGDPEQLKASLVGLGLQHAALYANDVGGWLPVDQLSAAAARGEVAAIRAAMPRKRSTGPVALQGDYAQRSDVIRTNYPALTGAGVTIGVLSDSFDCYSVYAQPGSGVPVSGYSGYAFNGFTADYAADVASAALPSGVNVLGEADCLNYGAPDQVPFGDEGRSMLQIVHAIAPGAALAFYTAYNSEADFAAGIGKLASAGAKVIADDAGYFDEPFYQDGIVAQAIDAAAAQGVAYFSAAGNDGTHAYENTAPIFTKLSTSAPNMGELLLNFDTTDATYTTTLSVTIPPIPPGDFVPVVVEWDQPYVTGCTATPSSLCTGATSQLDVCVTGGDGSAMIIDYDGNAVSCTGPNAIGVDSYQIMIVGNPASATANTTTQNLSIMVGVANGTAPPGRVIVAVEDNGLGISINQFATNSATVQGHPGAAGAAAVGAAFYFDTPRCGTTPATLEPYSSQGGGPILFSTAGVRLATPTVRQKPDFVGPDGVNDTFLGFTLANGGYTGADGLLNTSISECQNDPSYPNFFGTSAATPHAAAIAALMLQANSAITPTQIVSALQSSALAVMGSKPNFNSGYGFIQADAALAQLGQYAPGAPMLTLTASSITVGSSATLTWSSVNTTGCAGSGGWSGALAASGSQTVTPAAAGAVTYSLTCSNAAGTSPASTVTLTATPPAGGGGGGGALGGAALLGLAALGATRLRRARSR
jgi:hypothetical protein